MLCFLGTLLGVQQTKKTIFAFGLFAGLTCIASEDLLTACPGALERPIELSESCMAQLDMRFLDQPVWQAARLTYQVFDRRRSHLSDLNNRVKYLHYSSSDLQIAPVWSDIFDGGIESRNQAVIQSFNDADCTDLGADATIRADLADRCNGNDLIKYSLYIDACITSFTRVQMLSKPAIRNAETAKLESVFEHSLGVMERDADRQELTDFYLRSAWLLGRCQRMPITPMGVAAEELDGSPMTLVEMIELFRDSHDDALAMAAKTNNTWAQLMYIPVDLPVDSAYMQSLHEHNPLLAHRLMATVLSYGVLSVEDRIHHAVKAHELEDNGGNLFDYLDQFRFFGHDLERFEADLVEGLEVELKYPWPSR